ncbi:MAG: ROK family protein, partial [bacterium]
WFWGELRGMNSGVVVSLGESMGSALLWNEKPQQGRRGSIMELEHVSLETFGERMEGLPPGSSSNWLSGQGLRRQLKGAGIDCSLEELFTGEAEKLVEIREEFEARLAHLLGAVVMMLDPERLVLTGGLTASYKEWLSGVKEKMDDYVMEQFQGLPAVMLGQLRGEEVVKGPAAFWDWSQRE